MSRLALQPLHASRCHSVYEFRSFRNSDPPHLASIWRSQPPQRGIMQPVTVGLLEQFVFSKQYFDREGLIVATKDGIPVGFAHASFGPCEDRDQLDTEIGTTQLLMVHSDERDESLPGALLEQSENFLRSRGAKVLYAGGIHPLNAFYLGLYGGSELPGVLANDPFQNLLRTQGYQEIDRVVIFDRSLNGFRPPVTRHLRQVRREFVFSEHVAAHPQNWWEACTQGVFEHVEFCLRRRRTNTTVASVKFWDIEPLASSWGERAAGMFDMYVDPEFRRRGLATFLMCESFTQLVLRGTTMVEAQTMVHNQPALSLYGELDFKIVDCGYVFRKGGGQANGNLIHR